MDNFPAIQAEFRANYLGALEKEDRGDLGERRPGWLAESVWNNTIGWNAKACRKLPLLCDLFSTVLPTVEGPVHSWLQEMLEIFVMPSPATHAILIQLKAGETADLL